MITREGLILALSIQMYFLIHPKGWINDERMAVHCLESGCIGAYIPSELEISFCPQDVSEASGNLNTCWLTH